MDQAQIDGSITYPSISRIIEVRDHQAEAQQVRSHHFLGY
jgi:hypothetical protein